MQVIVACVYVPPNGNAKEVSSRTGNHIHDLETSSPNALKKVTGDCNHCSLIFHQLFLTCWLSNKERWHLWLMLLMFTMLTALSPPPQPPWAHLHVVGMSWFMSRHKLTELVHSFLLCSCVCFWLYGPFNFISFLEFSGQLSVFSLTSSGLDPFNYIHLFWKSPSALI